MEAAEVWAVFAPIIAISTGVWGCIAALGDYLEFKDKNLKEWRNLEWFRDMPFSSQNQKAKLRVGQWTQVWSKFLAGFYALVAVGLVYFMSGQMVLAGLVLTGVVVMSVATPIIGLATRRQRRLDIANIAQLAAKERERALVAKREGPVSGYDPDLRIPSE